MGLRDFSLSPIGRSPASFVIFEEGFSSIRANNGRVAVGICGKDELLIRLDRLICISLNIAMIVDMLYGSYLLQFLHAGLCLHPVFLAAEENDERGFLLRKPFHCTAGNLSQHTFIRILPLGETLSEVRVVGLHCFHSNYQRSDDLVQAGEDINGEVLIRTNNARDAVVLIRTHVSSSPLVDLVLLNEIERLTVNRSILIDDVFDDVNLASGKVDGDLHSTTSFLLFIQLSKLFRRCISPFSHYNTI